MKRRLLLCCLPLLSALPVVAQVSVTVSDPHFLSPATTITKNVDEVNLAFTVVDKKGHFVSDLRRDDFRFLDNHQEPQRLTLFQQRSDLPLDLAILIDASASVQDRFRFEQAAALAFIKKIVRPGKDKAFVIAFNDHLTTIQDLTDQTAKISKTLAKVKPEGNTSLYDAVIYASEKLHQIPVHEITRKAIVLISDGVDTVSRSTLEEAEQAAARTEVMIFALTTNYPHEVRDIDGDTVLRELATSTGGALLPSHDEGKLASAFRSVGKALHSQYVTAYNPQAFAPDGSYRTVEVIPLKEGLRTNCRKGYYAKARPQR